MAEFIFPAPTQPSVAISQSAKRFPVRRIYCVGRNYADHAREMGNDPDRDPPFFFSKPADTVVDSGDVCPYPPKTSDLHFEVELVLALSKGGSNIAPEAVREHIWGAAVGIDLTRRDLQSVAKKMGRPWDLAKGFDFSAPIAPLTPIADVPSLKKARIWLEVNGTMRQDGDIAQMIWPVDELVAILSTYVALAPGDLIMTGTPAGVGAVAPGDVLKGGIEGLNGIDVTIGPQRDS